MQVREEDLTPMGWVRLFIDPHRRFLFKQESVRRGFAGDDFGAAGFGADDSLPDDSFHEDDMNDEYDDDMGYDDDEYGYDDMGELRPIELGSIAAHGLHRTTLVLTHADNVASKEHVHRVTARIADQLWDHFAIRYIGTGQVAPRGIRPRPFNVVGIGRYWLGWRHGRADLQHASGIPRLRHHLQGLAARHGRSP